MKPNLIIIGLGNPGAQYAATRHNVGFQAVDVLSDAYGEGEWQESQKFQCRMQEARVVTVPVLLVQPTTFVNRSGECIRKIVEFYKLNPRQQILVLCDEIDLPVGESRLRMNGGPGTHNGLRSIVVVLGEEFPRLRLGIGGTQPRGDELAAWVLSVPPQDERQKIDGMIQTLPSIIKEFVMGTVQE